jgi:hypothetical protein
MIAAIGPADHNFDETCNTLRYANRAKSIVNKAKINENPKDAKIREMQSEIEILKLELAKMMGNTKIEGMSALQFMSGKDSKEQAK